MSTGHCCKKQEQEAGAGRQTLWHEEGAGSHVADRGVATVSSLHLVDLLQHLVDAGACRGQASQTTTATVQRPSQEYIAGGRFTSEKAAAKQFKQNQAETQPAPTFFVTKSTPLALKSHAASMEAGVVPGVTELSRSERQKIRTLRPLSVFATAFTIACSI